MTATNGTLTPLDLNFPLPLSPSSPSAALSTLNINHTPTSANHSKRNNLTIHSSQFSKNFEKEHLLSNSIKSAILEYGRSIKEAEYKGERSNGNLKVLGRSDVVMVTRDGMSVSAEKSKRLEESLKRGFASDYKEPYKPLGHPILDSNELILQSFNIAHSEQTPDTQNSLISDSQHTSVKSVKGIRSGGNKFPKMDYSGNSRSNSTVVLSDPTPPNKAETTPEKEINRNLNPDDGFELIRSRLNLSKMKLHAVKYGASFWEVDERTEKEKGKTEVPNPPKKSAERNEMKNDGAKWNNTRGIDLTMCAKEVEISKGTKSGRNIKSNTEYAAADAEPETLSVTKSAMILSRPPSSADDKKSLEKSLNINAISIPDSNELIMTARTTFVESKQKLAEELQENMKKIDRTRQSICQRKYKAFKIESNGICRNDLNLMRQRAQEVYLAEKTELLGLHPWYNDLVHKVVYCSGAKTAMSKCEAKLLKCIKSIILDDLEITKPQVVRMMKLVPPGEFMKEDIQKIFRFVKINVGLSDVDYLEAIKQSHEQKE